MMTIQVEAKTEFLSGKKPGEKCISIRMFWLFFRHGLWMDICLTWGSQSHDCEGFGRRVFGRLRKMSKNQNHLGFNVWITFMCSCLKYTVIKGTSSLWSRILSVDLPQNLEGWHDSWNAMLSPWTLEQRIIQGFTGLGRNARVVCNIGQFPQISTVAATYLWAIQSIPSLDKTMQWIWVMEPLPAKKQTRMKCPNCDSVSPTHRKWHLQVLTDCPEALTDADITTNAGYLLRGCKQSLTWTHVPVFVCIKPLMIRLTTEFQGIDVRVS